MKFYFLVFNLILIAGFAFMLFPTRISNLRIQSETLVIRERHLEALERNYAALEENISFLQDAPRPTSFGGKGETLMDILIMSGEHNLQQLEFSAFSQYVDLDNITETQATIAASGRFDDISNFLHDLNEKTHNIQIRRVQLFDEADYKRLRITFSVFE